jgi:outer membrane protein assembly factor BamA
MYHTGPRLRTTFEALGIIRSADRFRWDSENLGHRLKFETRMISEKGMGVGGSLYDVVSPVESWQFTDQEAGLSTFVLHRDFRDYYGRHGGALHTTFFRGYERELEFSYANERWNSRPVRDTWTLFRDDKPWRPNPEVNEGQVHILAATLRVDTRNSETTTRSGWFVNSTLERGFGDLSEPGAPGTLAPITYSRAMIDLRRYSRLSANGQVNFRIVYGARLGDDELPMQKRFSVGGPGSLPGFDFRGLHGTTDVGMCSSGELLPGSPGLCERMALFQAEYRGDIHLDLFGSDPREGGDWRDLGRHTGAQWTLFADAGRGWLISGPAGEDVAGLSYHSRTILPRLGTFRTDVGAGLDLGFIAVFVAKSVSQTDVPANFFVRLRHRF